MVGISTVAGWGTLIALGGGYWYYINRSPNSKRLPNRAAQQKELKEKERAKAAQKEKESKSRKAKSGGESSGNEAQKNKTKKEAKDEGPVFATSQDNSPDDKVDDLEFARQLNSVKTGTSIASKQQAGSRQKSVKLSKAVVSDDDDDVLRRTNGEHGSDGDDDLSSAASPEFHPTVLKAGDVSDMLENTTSTGPTVLRLTEPTTKQLPKPKKEVKPQQAEPTKKQRQNQAKKEAAKQQRHEEEIARRALEEKQRRTAREAEGRSAKDGSSTFYTPHPPTQSAWTNNHGSDQEAPVQLLDTYSERPSTGSRHHGSQADQQANPSTTSRPTRLDEYAQLPSEEEQLRILSENDGWNEVKTKKSKGKLAKSSSEVLGSGPADITNGSSNGKFDKLGEFETEA